MWTLIDLLLLLGLTLRLTRLVVGDSISWWYLREPAVRWAQRRTGRTGWNEKYEPRLWQERLVSGLFCPYCVGFWIAAATVLSLLLVGGPGHAADWWRWVALVFTLNYVAAKIGGVLGDTD